MNFFKSSWSWSWMTITVLLVDVWYWLEDGRSESYFEGNRWLCSSCADKDFKNASMVLNDTAQEQLCWIGTKVRQSVLSQQWPVVVWPAGFGGELCQCNSCYVVSESNLCCTGFCVWEVTCRLAIATHSNATVFLGEEQETQNICCKSAFPPVDISSYPEKD